MTVLVLGLDGLDATDQDMLDVPTSELWQDFDGGNALWTYRVWPCIFAGETGGEEDEFPYSYYDSPDPYIWDKHPARVFQAPISRDRFQKNQEAFPSVFRESYRPEERLQESLDRYDEGITNAIDDGIPLVVAVTRAPDFLQHWGGSGHRDWIETYCEKASEWCEAADDYLVVSDHGFDDPGTSGIEAHSRRSVLGSSFCEYDTMTAFCEGWHDDLDAVLREQQMQDLGYL